MITRLITRARLAKGCALIACGIASVALGIKALTGLHPMGGIAFIAAGIAFLTGGIAVTQDSRTCTVVMFVAAGISLTSFVVAEARFAIIAD